MEPDKRSQMVERSSGRSSVPQIFISNMHVGGYDEISQLEKSGRLDVILRESKG